MSNKNLVSELLLASVYLQSDVLISFANDPPTAINAPPIHNDKNAINPTSNAIILNIIFLPLQRETNNNIAKIIKNNPNNPNVIK